jgi:hypothetical protein
MIATTAQIQDYKTAKHTRLVSFENSNSWLKRHDDEGTLVIQAGFTEQIGMMAKGDNENPIVINKTSKRWYGSRACLGQHTRIHGRDKVGTARDAFAACLRPSDDGRDLIVIASHWDYENLESLKGALEGQYNITRNGETIKCTVTKVLPVLEGLGSYEAVKPKLEAGYSLLIELGFGTAEEWLIDESGEVIDGKPVTALGVSKLVDSIAADPSVKAGLGITSNSVSVNLSLISAGLQSETLGKLAPDQWKAIKRKHVNAWFETIQAHISTQYESQSQNLVNLILTGGGAALLKTVKPDVIEFFTIPDRPQVASVIGAYEAQMAKVGV